MADVETSSVIVEVKSREELPKWLKDAVAQARSYNKDGSKLPIVCLKEKGKQGFLVVIYSYDFRQWFGDLIDKEG